MLVTARGVGFEADDGGAGASVADAPNTELAFKLELGQIRPTTAMIPHRFRIWDRGGVGVDAVCGLWNRHQGW